MIFFLTSRSQGLYKTFKEVLRREKFRGLWIGTIPVCFVLIQFGFSLHNLPNTFLVTSLHKSIGRGGEGDYTQVITVYIRHKKMF